MKKFSILIIFSFCVCTFIQAQHTFVLAVGVSRYQNQANNLNQTTKDAKSFAELMKVHTSNVSIITSRNANKSNILSKLRKICNTATQNDRVIFYFSGHGYNGGICTYDDFISYGDIVSIFNNCRAKIILTIIDACHAGSVATTNQNLKLKNNMAFLMSSRPNEYSAEVISLGAGIFTNGVLKGLRGKADKNKNKGITIYELYEYVHKDVINHNPEQHPQLIAPKNTYNIQILKWK